MNPDLAWAVWCGERQRRSEDMLARVLPAADQAPVPLSRAMRYAVLDGGKRIRPLLAYAAGELVELDVVGANRVEDDIALMVLRRNPMW